MSIVGKGRNPRKIKTVKVIRIIGTPRNIKENSIYSFVV